MTAIMYTSNESFWTYERTLEQWFCIIGYQTSILNSCVMQIKLLTFLILLIIIISPSNRRQKIGNISIKEQALFFVAYNLK